MRKRVTNQLTKGIKWILRLIGHLSMRSCDHRGIESLASQIKCTFKHYRDGTAEGDQVGCTWSLATEKT